MIGGLSRRERRAGRRVPPGVRLERWHRTVMRRRWTGVAVVVLAGLVFLLNPAWLGSAVQAVASRPALLLLLLAAVLLVVDGAASRVHARHDHREQG